MCADSVSHAQEERPANEPRRWTTQWSFEDIDLKDLASKLRLIGLRLPVEIAGRAAIDFDVSIPVTALRSLKQYRFKGSLRVRDLIADDAEFQTFDAEVDYREGLLKFERLRATQGAGTISGKARAMLDPSDKFDAELQVQSVDIEPIAKLLAKFGIGTEDKPIRGFADANVRASGNVSELKQPTKWDIVGNLRAAGIAVGASHQYGVDVREFQLVDGEVTVVYQVRATDLPEFFAAGKANFRFDGTDAFDIEIATNDLPLTDILGMYFESPKTLVDGKLDLQGNVKGKFVDGEPLPQFVARASLASPNITFFGVELGLLEHDLLMDNRSFSLTPRSTQSSRKKSLVQRLSASFAATDTHFKFTEVSAEFFGGLFKGAADVARLAEGNHAVKAVWQNIDPVVHWQFPGKSDEVIITGKTSGKLNWTAPANRLDQPSFHRGETKIAINELALVGQSIGGLTATASISEKAIQTNGDGTLFGGKARVSTTAPLEADAKWSDVTQRILGEIEVEEAAITQLLSISELSEKRFDGTISGLLRFRREAGVPFVATSEWTVRNLRVNRTTLSNKITFSVQSKNDALTLSSLRGTTELLDMPPGFSL